MMMMVIVLKKSFSQSIGIGYCNTFTTKYWHLYW